MQAFHFKAMTGHAEKSFRRCAPPPSPRIIFLWHRKAHCGRTELEGQLWIACAMLNHWLCWIFRPSFELLAMLNARYESFFCKTGVLDIPSALGRFFLDILEKDSLSSRRPLLSLDTGMEKEDGVFTRLLSHSQCVWFPFLDSVPEMCVCHFLKSLGS